MCRKFCYLILGIILCFLLFYKTPEKQTVVKFASWGSESEISILKPLLEDFELKNPEIKVEFMHIPQNYFQKIHLLFASNTAPDVIFINNQYLPLYANAGVLEELNSYEFDYNVFYKKSLNALTINKKIYAIPRDISNLVIFYNKDIFKKYNVKFPKSNWSLDDLLTVSKKLSYPPEIFGISFDEEPLYFLYYVAAFGGWTKDDVETFFEKDISSNKNIMRGLNFYADLRRKYHVSPYKSEVASATMAQMFLQGKLGMHLSGRWLVPKYRAEANFDWDIVEFPNNGNSLLIDASGWSIAKSSKHKKEAIKLIQYLSSKYAIEKITQSGLIVPARIDVANSEVFLDNKKPKNSKAFLQTIENSRPTPVVTDYKIILDTLKMKTEKLFNSI